MTTFGACDGLIRPIRAVCTGTRGYTNRKGLIAFAAWTSGMLSGCAVYQPLISHQVDTKNFDKYDPRVCVGDVMVTPSLKRACMKLQEIETARSTHQYLNAVSTNVLIPLTAFVAYRTAKQQHATSTGGLAAGGVAGYLTVGQLAPGQRIEGYSRGTKAISCAIGKYRRAMASVTLATIERQSYEAALAKANEKIADLLKADKNSVAARAGRFYINSVESAVLSHSATTDLDASLDEFIGQAIEDLNNILRGTLPTLAGLSSRIAALTDLAPKLPAPTSAETFSLASTSNPKPEEDARQLEILLKELKSAAEALMQAEVNRASADFSPCQISLDALVAQGIYKPLMLGAGDVQQGRTVPLDPKSPQIIPLVGGLAPMTHLITGANDDFKPTVEITMQGVSVLTIAVVKQDAATTHTYRVTIVDSAGATRWLDVVVPAESKPEGSNQSNRKSSN